MIESKKIVILGDSFAEIDVNLKYLWQNIIREKLQRDIVNVAANGASSEWMMFKLFKYIQPNLQYHDFFIVIIPYFDRVCIWPEYPDLNSIFPIQTVNKHWLNNLETLPPILFNKLKDFSLKELTAFQYYFHYLHNTEFSIIKTLAFLNWINNISHTLEYKPLIIDSHNFIKNYTINLNNCTVAKGNLFSICENEYESKDLFYKLTNHGPFSDFRIGHMSECNHKIFATKILNYFNENIIPDLTTDFYTGFINEQDHDKKDVQKQSAISFKKKSFLSNLIQKIS